MGSSPRDSHIADPHKSGEGNTAHGVYNRSTWMGAPVRALGACNSGHLPEPILLGNYESGDGLKVPELQNCAFFSLKG